MFRYRMAAILSLQRWPISIRDISAAFVLTRTKPAVNLPGSKSHSTAQTALRCAPWPLRHPPLVTFRMTFMQSHSSCSIGTRFGMEHLSGMGQSMVTLFFMSLHNCGVRRLLKIAGLG